MSKQIRRLEFTAVSSILIQLFINRSPENRFWRQKADDLSYRENRFFAFLSFLRRLNHKNCFVLSSKQFCWDISWIKWENEIYFLYKIICYVKCQQKKTFFLSASCVFLCFFCLRSKFTKVNVKNLIHLMGTIKQLRV